MSRLKLVAAGAAVLAGAGIVGAACGESSEPERAAPVATREKETSDRPGDSATYRRIEALRSCAKLQAELARFMTMHGNSTPGTERAQAALAYANAAERRWQEVGCES